MLHTFLNRAYDGDGVAGLVIGEGPGGSLALYGVTSGGGIYGYGTAFSLTPPAQPGSSWTEKILYNFNGPEGAAFPNPGLVMGKGGVIYGTAYGILGGGPGYSGAVFSLTPPSGGDSWTMTVVHSFTGGDDGARESSAPCLPSSRSPSVQEIAVGQAIAFCWPAEFERSTEPRSATPAEPPTNPVPAAP